jgi:predicted cupin superfamily sugar epimerase
MLSAEEVIALLELRPLPREGGWYRETHRSALTLPAAALGPADTSGRSAATAIYYLLTPESFSALHRLPTDEVFHFYLGSAVEMLQLDPSTGIGRILILGSDLLAGQRPQVIVPAGVWQGSRLCPGGSFALLGTTMSPGFDFADYQGGDPDQLAAGFPAFADAIRRLAGPAGS